LLDGVGFLPEVKIFNHIVGRSTSKKKIHIFLPYSYVVSLFDSSLPKKTLLPTSSGRNATRQTPLIASLITIIYLFIHDLVIIYLYINYLFIF
jgi:hypothetical protein